MSTRTAPAIRARKVRGGGDPLVMVTAYDAPGARQAHAADVDLILVGDSLAMVVLGYDDTLQVTVDDIAHHVAAVHRGLASSTAEGRAPLVVGDMPWMSYHTTRADAVNNAAALVRAGASAVKLEGGRKRLPVVEDGLDCGPSPTTCAPVASPPTRRATTSAPMSPTAWGSTAATATDVAVGACRRSWVVQGSVTCTDDCS
jgi:hypothetical protein